MLIVQRTVLESMIRNEDFQCLSRLMMINFL